MTIRPMQALKIRDTTVASSKTAVQKEKPFFFAILLYPLRVLVALFFGHNDTDNVLKSSFSVQKLSDFFLELASTNNTPGQ